jgi:serine/threonine-protein kinase
MFLGKLKYASPEQAGFLKDDEYLDPRSDLYSFGIVMYEMLAGRAPFQATNPHGYILKHVTEKPAPISELNPGVNVPASLESIIMRSLEKNRDQRYETAADFAQALESIRTSIPPDQKYGVGEKMVTLSGAQTLADLPKMTAPAPTMSGAQPTQQTHVAPAARVGPTGTRVAEEEATLMERQITMPGSGAKDEATMIERLGGAAPTAIEQKWTPQAEMPPAAKKNSARIAAIAATIVIALIVAGFLVLRKKPADVATTNTVATPGTDITATAPTVPPAPAGQGVLLLSATPWGELEKIIRKDDQREITITDDKRSTPSRILLDPGSYSVTVAGPNSKQTTVDVQIVAGQPTRRTVQTGRVDYDALAEEVSKP